MYICTFKYTPEDVNCQFCMLYLHRRCTAREGCPFLAERIEAGVADYTEVIYDTFKSPSFILAARLMKECGMPIDAVLSADTGMEFPEMYEHLAKVDEYLYRERGIPFEMKLPQAKVVDMSKLTPQELDEELDKGWQDILDGRTIPAKQAFDTLRKKHGI